MEISNTNKLFTYTMKQPNINIAKKECVNAVRQYNNSYKHNIVKAYSRYVERDTEDIWDAQPPAYNEMVVGYLQYNDSIIPYTESSTIETIRSVLLNDSQFEFAGPPDDLNFQYVVSFLISVGFLKPRDEFGNLLFNVVSLFSGNNTKDDIKTYVELTQFIQYRYKKHYNFAFDPTSIVRKDNHREYTDNRVKLTLKLVNEIWTKKYN